MKKVDIKIPICPVCNKAGELIDYSTITRLKTGNVYICATFPQCDARIEADEYGSAFGTMANHELRSYREKVLAGLTHLATRKYEKIKVRNSSYTEAQSIVEGQIWLSKQLKIANIYFNVQNFNIDMCKEALIIMEPYLKKGE